jgi:hypothetical protein
MTRDEAIKCIVDTYSSNCTECHGDDFQEIHFNFNNRVIPMDLCETCFKDITQIMEVFNVDKTEFIVNSDYPY